MNDTTIPERWLLITRVIWFALVFLLLLIFIVSIPAYFNQVRVPCGGVDCQILALSPQEVQLLPDFGLSLDFYIGYVIGLGIFGFTLIFLMAGSVYWLRSSTWLGFLVSLALVVFGTFTAESSTALVRQSPNLAWPFFLLNFMTNGLVMLLFFLFPDGRFVPRWTWLLTIIFVVAFLLDLLLRNRGQLEPSYSITGNLLMISFLAVGVVAQIYRYRRISTPTQRQQTKWIMFGLVSLFIMLFIWTFLFELFPPQSSSVRLALKLGLSLSLILFIIFPISIVFSILRYRLWDIDIVIQRTLVYGLLTLSLLLIYFGSVVLLQEIFSTVTGQRSAVAIVVSTLLIAALFAPLRQRIQNFIDRRFYRRKYDAVQTLAQFSQTAREEVELETLTAELVQVVQETMQPETVSLWLPAPRSRKDRIKGFSS